MISSFKHCEINILANIFDENEVPAAYTAPNLSCFLVTLDRYISILLLACHCSLQAVNSIIKYQQFWVFRDSFYPFPNTGLNRSFPLILSQALRQSDSFNRLFNNGLALNEALFGFNEISVL